MQSPPATHLVLLPGLTRVQRPVGTVRQGAGISKSTVLRVGIDRGSGTGPGFLHFPEGPL